MARWRVPLVGTRENTTPHLRQAQVGRSDGGLEAAGGAGIEAALAALARVRRPHLVLEAR